MTGISWMSSPAAACSCDRRAARCCRPAIPAPALLDAADAATEARFQRDRKEAERLRRSAGALKNIGINSRSDAAQKKSAQIAERAAALEDRLRPRHRERSGAIQLDSSALHSKLLLRLEKLVVQTPQASRLFRVEKLELAARDRLVLLGANGAGKSRFLALLESALAGSLAPGLWLSPALRPGYLDQEMARLPGAQTPLAWLADQMPPEQRGDRRATSLLAGAGIAVAAQSRPIAALSPGQRSRLGLLGLRLTRPNFFLLDEPTNHLDIPGREALETEILAQEAACILVSHDRHFVRAIGTRFLRIEGGTLREVAMPPEYRG